MLQQPDSILAVEVEVNNQLPFLDVLVHRKPSGDLKTTQTVEAKPKASDRTAKDMASVAYIDGVSEAVSGLLRPMGIGIAHRRESTIRHLVMRPLCPEVKQQTSSTGFIAISAQSTTLER
ncbi:unnamed protein product, partial [Schistocephalus solidus]|uniref:HGTP_anticodon2 domain-containing protein n=1 Tax=Schistocephalus solidus TaxID=70667 RepID=A0A183T6L5_SCHSO